MRLLVVEDNVRLAEYVSIACCAKAFVVDLALSLADARDFIEGARYDAVVLDRGLPDGDGLGWLKEIRRGGLQTSVLVLTARDTPQAVVRGLTSVPMIT